jgi:hypothetical protein
MTSLAGAPEAIASADASIWNKNGTGSSSYSKKKVETMRRVLGEDGMGKTYLWSKFVYERFQSIFGDISGQIDGWC